ncbi:MAG: hypothetical protein K1X67_07815 [Fimbriimonadaceae bacterium]|nr:hypothetical protein [Fimbriimonadaceae bacterium]
MIVIKTIGTINVYLRDDGRFQATPDDATKPITRTSLSAIEREIARYSACKLAMNHQGFTYRVVSARKGPHSWSSTQLRFKGRRGMESASGLYNFDPQIASALEELHHRKEAAAAAFEAERREILSQATPFDYDTAPTEEGPQ